MDREEELSWSGTLWHEVHSCRMEALRVERVLVPDLVGPGRASAGCGPCDVLEQNVLAAWDAIAVRRLCSPDGRVVLVELTWEEWVAPQVRSEVSGAVGHSVGEAAEAGPWSSRRSRR